MIKSLRSPGHQATLAKADLSPLVLGSIIRHTMNSACIMMSAGVMLVFCGCEKRAPGGTVATAGTPDIPGKTAANLMPVNPADSAQLQDRARMAAALAMRRGDTPPPSTSTLVGGEPATPEILADYNKELLRVRIQERRSPENLEDLVQKWINRWRLLPALPTAPPGKRIIYDDVNCIVRLDPP